MNRLILIVSLVAVTCGLSGCGGSDKPPPAAGAGTPKAPDVPPQGP